MRLSKTHTGPQRWHFLFCLKEQSPSISCLLHRLNSCPCARTRNTRLPRRAKSFQQTQNLPYSPAGSESLSSPGDFWLSIPLSDGAGPSRGDLLVSRDICISSKSPQKPLPKNPRRKSGNDIQTLQISEPSLTYKLPH